MSQPPEPGQNVRVRSRQYLVEEVSSGGAPDVEMESRFGLGSVVLDRDYLAACRRERGFGVNPGTTHTRFVLSHALPRDETHAGTLRDGLGDSAPGTNGRRHPAPRAAGSTRRPGPPLSPPRPAPS